MDEHLAAWAKLGGYLARASDPPPLTLPEALEQAAILADAPIHAAIVDKGYRGVGVCQQ